MNIFEIYDADGDEGLKREFGYLELYQKSGKSLMGKLVKENSKAFRMSFCSDLPPIYSICLHLERLNSLRSNKGSISKSDSSNSLGASMTVFFSFFSIPRVIVSIDLIPRPCKERGRRLTHRKDAKPVFQGGACMQLRFLLFCFVLVLLLFVFGL
jgi:hypothetical protein